MIFWDFEGFNLALLAKKSLRMLLSPSSLVYNVSRLSISHMEMSWLLGYLQRNLLEGRNLLSLGLRYRTGNSLSSDICPDKWIPSLCGHTPSPFYLFRGRERKVASLIDVN